MRVYLTKRVLMFFPNLLLVTVAVFVILRVVPGDPGRAAAGRNGRGRRGAVYPGTARRDAGQAGDGQAHIRPIRRLGLEDAPVGLRRVLLLQDPGIRRHRGTTARDHRIGLDVRDSRQRRGRPPRRLLGHQAGHHRRLHHQGNHHHRDSPAQLLGRHYDYLLPGAGLRLLPAPGLRQRVG